MSLLSSMDNKEDVSDVSIADALKRSTCLQEGSESPDLDAQLLLGHVLKKEVSYLYTWPEKMLNEQQLRCFDELIAQRIKGEPIAYLLGHQDFWSLRLEVSRDTLIPRPDTELLVETALSLSDLLNVASVRIADLGTGTGAVALALASEKPLWKVYASDFLDAAAKLAARNAKRLKLSNVTILTGSWFDPHVDKYHLIVSNPPYIDPSDYHLNQGDVRFEPLTALISADAGLKDIKEIITDAPSYLESNGYLMLEHGYDQGKNVRELLLLRGFSNVKTSKDLANNDRVTLGQWLL